MLHRLRRQRALVLEQNKWELDEILQGRDCSDGDEALLQRALGKAEEVMRMVNARLQEARIQPHELGING